MGSVRSAALLAILAACSFDGDVTSDAPHGDARGPDAGPDAAPCNAPFSRTSHGCHAFPADTGISALGWPAARAACQALGGDLPVIETEGESAHVASAATIPTQRVWLGLTGTTLNGASWTWVDGDTVAQQGLNLWVSGQPEAGDECATVRPDTARWSGRKCTNPLLVVCERP
jgi:hypothetical protein